MRLEHRPTRPKDLTECLDLSFGHVQPNVRVDLVSLWKKLMADHCVISSVVEDRDRPSGRRIVGFGLGLFVTDDFLREAKADLPPFLALQILAKWKKGNHAWFNRQEIARHNAGMGLNLMVVHYRVEHQATLEAEVPIRYQMLKALLGLHGAAGYRFKELAQETLVENDLVLIQQSGMKIRRDYAEWNGLSALPPDLRPHLIGITQEESNVIAHSHSIFMSPRPRFAFSPGEKDMLERALEGETDRKIGGSLKLSVWTVKKRWQSVYGKVEKIEHGFFQGQERPGPDPKKESIEQQRRRILLSYLQSHCEEIRPYSPIRAKTSS